MEETCKIGSQLARVKKRSWAIRALNLTCSKRERDKGEKSV